MPLRPLRVRDVLLWLGATTFGITVSGPIGGAFAEPVQLTSWVIDNCELLWREVHRAVMGAIKSVATAGGGGMYVIGAGAGSLSWCRRRSADFSAITGVMGNTELLDVVTPTGTYLESLPRTEVHEQGLWHQTFHCLVVRPTHRTVILQERSLEKSSFGGLCDLSVTGHLEAGESPADGIRELQEELGVDASMDQLVPVGVRLLADDLGEGHTNRERVHVFFMADDRPVSDYRPPIDEVSALVEIDVTDFGALFGPDHPTIGATRHTIDDDAQPMELRAEDLVVPTDGYWVVLAVMAQRFIDGVGPIAV
jgi:isopentenyldiphosphate isomerase